MLLIGSAPSPYVRRIRLFLHGKDCTFMDLNIYSPEGREVLRKYTPAMKIPVLVDGDTTIFDSRVIHRYAAEKVGEPALNWHQENLLSMVDAVNDSFVILALSKRSGINIDDDLLLMNLQKERIKQTLQLLEDAAAKGDFDHWDYPAICLYSLVDWVIFRELTDFSPYPALLAFHAKNSTLEAAKVTDPRTAA
jgi:glutathione S-transferase